MGSDLLLAFTKFIHSQEHLVNMKKGLRIRTLF